MISFIIYKDQKPKAETADRETDVSAQITDETVKSPVRGTIIPLSEVSDETFASEMLGTTVAVEPADGRIVSPCDGEVINIFDTGHAVCIATNSGGELLIHIGVDTVKLEERERLIRDTQAGPGSEPFKMEGCPVYDLAVGGISNDQFRAVLGEELALEYTDGRFEMRFTDRGKDSVSAGRGLRYAELERLEDVRILADVSSVEVFLNNGEYVFTTRYYPEKACVCVETEAAEIKFNVIED